MASLPLTKIVLAAGSVADDVSFVALADLARVLDDVDDYRIIGGHMVTALVARWQLGADIFRETGDTDLGAPPRVLKDHLIVGRLRDLGYEPLAGDRFGRPVEDVAGMAKGADPPLAIVDVLIPAYTSRPRTDRRVGDDLVTIEVPGLATALQRDAVSLSVDLVRLNGETSSIRLAYADEVSAVLLKALVTGQRSKDTDLVDLWRSLEVAYVAGVGPAAFDNKHGKRAAELIRSLFPADGGRGGAALASSQRLSAEAVLERVTRIRALAERVLGPER